MGTSVDGAIVAGTSVAGRSVAVAIGPIVAGWVERAALGATVGVVTAGLHATTISSGTPTFQSNDLILNR